MDEAIIRAGWAIWSVAPRDGEPPAGDALVGAFLASEARVALIDARAPATWACARRRRWAR
ncbi:hypothetical protein P0F65_04765 [Sphingomonas sp. I4]